MAEALPAGEDPALLGVPAEMVRYLALADKRPEADGHAYNLCSCGRWLRDSARNHKKGETHRQQKVAFMVLCE